VGGVESEDEMGRQTNRPQEDKGGAIPARRKPGIGAHPNQGRSQPRPYVFSAAVSAGVLLFAAAFFVLGFAAHVTIDDDDSGSTSAVSASPASPSGPSPQGSPSAQPTPASVVQVSVDDDPFIGPADALVTIIDFSDFQ